MSRTCAIEIAPDPRRAALVRAAGRLVSDEEIRVDEGTIRVVPLWRWTIERAADEA